MTIIHSINWHIDRRMEMITKLRDIEQRTARLRIALQTETFKASIADFRRAGNDAKCILGDASDMQTMIERYLSVVEKGGVSDDADDRDRVRGAPLDADAGRVGQRVTRNDRAAGDALTFIDFQDANGDFYLINLCEERDGTYAATALRAMEMDIPYEELPVIAQVAAFTRDDALIQLGVSIGAYIARLEGGDAADVNG